MSCDVVVLNLTRPLLNTALDAELPPASRHFLNAAFALLYWGDAKLSSRLCSIYIILS